MEELCAVCQKVKFDRHRDCYTLYTYPPAPGKILNGFHFFELPRTPNDHDDFPITWQFEMIVSDRDPRFMSLFWKAIWENIGTQL
ncbi:hypothetical protein DD606_24125 [Enterobacter cloacae complex sp. GF14B]|nr:hypothetical protein DD606_24125 [Enterobacter cloacae complex sp. GF14B]